MPLIPVGWSLFIVDIEYIVPMEQVQTVLEPHLEFVRNAYAEGRFIASGPKVPRTGGVVVMCAPSLEDAQAFNAADPFVTAGVADYRYTQFLASNMADALK